MKIILGSQSTNRKAVLESAGYEFDVLSANIKEKKIRSDNPQELTLLIAKAKTERLLSNIKDQAILITADTVVVCNNKILEKPINYQEALEFYQLYSSHPVNIVTALVVTNTKTKQQKSIVEQTKLWLTPFSDEEIQSMRKRNQIVNFAGGFTVLEPIIKRHIKKIEGSYDNAAGLPLNYIKKFIKSLT